MIFDVKITGQTLSVPSGLVLASGARETVKVRLICDDAWEGLTLTLTCRTAYTIGVVARTVSALTPDTGVVIPAECMIPGGLFLGVTGYGADGSQKLTTARMLRPIEIRSSEDDDHPIGGQITPEMAEQLMASIGSLDSLTTEEKTTIVAALNELHQKTQAAVKSVNVCEPDDTGNVSLSGADIQTNLLYIPEFAGSVEDAIDILAYVVYRKRISTWGDALTAYPDYDLLGLPIMNPDADDAFIPMHIIRDEDETAGELVTVPSVKHTRRIAKEELPTGISIKNGKIYLSKNGVQLGHPAELDNGISFDSGYVDEQGYLHLTLGGTEIPGFEPFYIGSASEAPGDLILEGDRLYLSKDGVPMGEGVTLPAGGGTGSGTGSVMKLLNGLSGSAFSVQDTAREALIRYSWSSVDAEDGSPTGKGSASWFVGDKRVATQSVDQGENSFDILPYLEIGVANTVKLTVEDAYGTVRSRIWTVTVISFGLSWDFGEMDSHSSAPLSVRVIPTGMGDKTLRVYVDGQEHFTQTVASTGRTVTVDIPALSHGAHRITATLELDAEGETLRTEPLTHVGIWTEEGNTEPVVAFFHTAVDISQYATASLPYLVYDPLTENAGITLYDNGAEVRTLTVGRGMQNWAYRPTTEGQTTLKIEVNGTDTYGEIPVTVRPLGYEIAPVTAGLRMECNPAGHSNRDSDRESFGYTDGSGENHPFVFSEGFDWENGGFRQDEDGVTALVIKRGSTVTLDSGFFRGDASASGKEMKLILRVKNCRDYNGTFLTCYQAPVGLVLKAQEGTLSSESKSLTFCYCEEEKLELDINLSSGNQGRLATIWLSGVPCGAFAYASTDSWAQGTPQPVVIGSPDCDLWLYGLRLYGNGLTQQDILANYIADCGSTAEMIARYERNDIYSGNGTLSISKLSEANPDLRILHISASDMTTSKTHEVTCRVELTHKNGKGFSATDVVMKAQGTSSLEYGLAALNLDLDFSHGVWTDDRGERITSFAMTERSVPVDYFNIKLNVASSENANNVCLAEEYNRFNPYRSQPRRDNNQGDGPLIRDTVEGHPCAVFLTNTATTPITAGARTLMPGETVLYGCGDMNNSKKNFAVFGQDNSLYPKQCCVEILNNNNAPCRFKSDDLSTETWDGKEGTSNFEFRFPKNPTQEMKENFQSLLSWVVSTDPLQATGEALPRPVQYKGLTYNTDSADYRRAKFRQELGDHFAVDSVLFHYLFTEYHLMADNRAKNCFLSYEWDPDVGGYRWNFNKDYDNDTAAGTDNSGGLSFYYGLEDTDSVGAQMVFNASDSVLWCNVRDLMGEELKAMFRSLESQKAWDTERILQDFSAYQSPRPEILVAEDMWAKYIMPYLNHGEQRYLEMAQGTKTLQRGGFYRYRRPYMASKYESAYATSDSLSLRANEVSDLSVTLYSDGYVHVRFGNAGSVKVRGKCGQEVMIPCKADTANDLETYIYSAGSISRLGDLSGLMADRIELGSAVKLRNLPLGSQEPGYENRDLEQLSFGTVSNLESIELSGLTGLKGTLDLSAFDGLREIYAVGSGISGVIFPAYGAVERAVLPPVGTLSLRGLQKLESLSMEPSGLVNLRLEDCPTIDSLSLCRQATALQRGRLTQVNWHNADTDLLLRLAGLTGYDGEGKVTDRFVLTGTAYVPTICSEELDLLRRTFPNLELTYGEIVPAYTLTFQNYDGTVLFTRTVRRGGNGEDPVASGLIPTPEKAPTVDRIFRFGGWDGDLTSVTEDRVITAIYAHSPRKYTVRWYDGIRLLQTDVVEVYDRVSYKGADLIPETEGELWIGWDKTPEALGSVVEDMDVHGVYLTPTLPSRVAIGYDYLYSDDPADKMGYSLGEFYGIIYGGKAEEYFTLGDRIKLCTDSTVFTDRSLVFTLNGFRHFTLANDKERFADLVFGMVGVMNSARLQNGGSNTTGNKGGWPVSSVRAFLQRAFPTLPQHWRALIKKVTVLSSAGGNSATIVESEDQLFLFSCAEVGYQSTAIPYKDEVDPGAASVTLPVFTDNSSRIRAMYNGEGTAQTWWLRSPVSTSSYYHTVTAAGAGGSTGLSQTAYLSFGFCI